MENDFHKISQFNRVVLELFVRLHNAFPHPQNINSQTALSLGLGEIPGDTLEGEEMSLGTKANNVMEWLSEEGFIRYDPDPNYRPGTFWKVRLTLKGVTLLEYIPVSIEHANEKKPLIHEAKQALSAVQTAKEYEKVNRVVAEIFKMAVGYKIP